MIKKLSHIFFIIFSCINLFSQQNHLAEQYFKALNYYQSKNIDSAEIVLKKNIEEEKFVILLGKIYNENNKTNEAILILEKNYQKNQSNEIAFNLALIYAEMDFDQEAIFWLEKYFLNNNLSDFYSQIIKNKEFTNIENSELWKNFWNNNTYNKNYQQFEEILYNIKQENFEEAVQLLNTCKSISYDYYKNYLLADVYFKMNDLKLANKYILLSLESKSKFYEAQNLKYQIDKLNKDYKSAENILDKMMKSDIFNSNLILEKVDLLYKLKNYTEAQKILDYYSNFFPTDKIAILLKAKISI
ncbi:MAG: hypothetical protein LBV69_00600, partial [Bacteroidales bacterium]|nr:hypothetical protein [Bacteroidales bacterium]